MVRRSTGSAADGGDGGGTGGLSRLWAWYPMLSKRWPVTVAALTGGMLVGTADVTTQKLIEKRERLDVRRTITMTVFGLGYQGGMCVGECRP